MYFTHQNSRDRYVHVLVYHGNALIYLCGRRPYVDSIIMTDYTKEITCPVCRAILERFFNG